MLSCQPVLVPPMASADDGLLFLAIAFLGLCLMARFGRTTTPGAAVDIAFIRHNPVADLGGSLRRNDRMIPSSTSAHMESAKTERTYPCIVFDAICVAILIAYFLYFAFPAVRGGFVKTRC